MDDYAWPSEANYELVRPVRNGIDVPLTWSQTLPRPRFNQTAVPLIKPAGGNIAKTDNITLFVNSTCAAPISIYWTCTGEVPVPGKSNLYTGPFSLGCECARDDWFQKSHVVVGAVAVCPGVQVSPVNARWFYLMDRSPPPCAAPAVRPSQFSGSLKVRCAGSSTSTAGANATRSSSA